MGECRIALLELEDGGIQNDAVDYSWKYIKKPAPWLSVGVLQSSYRQWICRQWILLPVDFATSRFNWPYCVVKEIQA